MREGCAYLDQNNESRKRIADQLQLVIEVVQRSIIGNRDTIKKIIISLISGGHILLEGPPGVAKTKTAVALSSILGADYKRIQCTPDLLPSDITGIALFRPDKGLFEVQKGPIFTNILLADEINRTPAKVQSALLEAMAENQVTLFGTTEPLPTPFFVIATQNPIEQEGTYPLPEAQLDRFMMKLQMKHLDLEEEIAILSHEETLQPTKKERINDSIPLDSIKGITLIQEAMNAIQSIYVDPEVVRYIAEIVVATRDKKKASNYKIEGFLRFGASSRASIALLKGAKASALLEKRGFVTPHDVKQIAKEVLSHRIGLEFESEARGVTVGEIVEQLLSSIPVP